MVRKPTHGKALFLATAFPAVQLRLLEGQHRPRVEAVTKVEARGPIRETVPEARNVIAQDGAPLFGAESWVSVRRNPSAGGTARFLDTQVFAV